MEKDTRDFGPDSIEAQMRERVRETIEAIVEEELETALGARPSSRTEGRQGYRHGVRPRTLTTSLGPTTIGMPRGRLRDDPARTPEWVSKVSPRYQRRSVRGQDG